MSADVVYELKPLVELSNHLSTTSRTLKSEGTAMSDEGEERTLVLSVIDALQQQTDKCEKDLADRLGTLKHHVLQMGEENRQAEWLPERYRHSVSAGNIAGSPAHGPASSVDYPSSLPRGSLGGAVAASSSSPPPSQAARSPLVLPATPNLTSTLHGTPFAHSVRPFTSVGPQPSGAIDGEVKAFLQHYVNWKGVGGAKNTKASAAASPIPKEEQLNAGPPLTSLLRDTVDDFVVQKLLSDGIALDAEMMDDFGLSAATRTAVETDVLRCVKEEVRRGVHLGRAAAGGQTRLAADWWEKLQAEELCEALLCHTFPQTYAWLRTLTAPPPSPSPAPPATNMSGDSYEYEGTVDDAPHVEATTIVTDGEAPDVTASAPVIGTEASSYTYSYGTEDASATEQSQRQTTQESAEAGPMAGTHTSDSMSEEAAERSPLTSMESVLFSTPSAGTAYHTPTEGGQGDSLAEYSLEGITGVAPPGSTRSAADKATAASYTNLNAAPEAARAEAIPVPPAQYEVNPQDVLQCRAALFESDLVFLCVLQELAFILEEARGAKKNHGELVVKTFAFLEKLQQDPAYDRYHRFLSGSATEAALLSHKAVLTAAGYMPMLLPPSITGDGSDSGCANDADLERFVLTVAPMLELWHGGSDVSPSAAPSYAPLRRGVSPHPPRKGPTSEAAAPILAPEVAPFVFLETVITGLMDAVSGLAEAARLLRGTKKKDTDKDGASDCETVREFCEREPQSTASVLSVTNSKDYISKFIYPLSQPIIQELEALQSRGLLPMDDITSTSDEDEPATPSEEGRTSPLKRHFSLPPSALDHLAEMAPAEAEEEEEAEEAHPPSPPVESRSSQAQAARALFAALFDMGAPSPPKKLALPSANARSAATLEIAHVSEVLTSLRLEQDHVRQVTSQCLQAACDPFPMFHSTMCYCPVSRRRCYDPLVSGAVTIMDTEDVLRLMRTDAPANTNDAFLQYYNQFVDPAPAPRADGRGRASEQPQRVHYISATTTAGTLLRGPREESGKASGSAAAAAQYRATTNLLPVPNAERVERLNPPQFLQCGHVISDRTLQSLLSVPRRSRRPDRFNAVSCPYCAVETLFTFIKTISTLY